MSPVRERGTLPGGVYVYVCMGVRGGLGLRKWDPQSGYSLRYLLEEHCG